MRKLNPSNKVRYQQEAMIGILLLTALLRLPSLATQSVTFDEGYSIAVGSTPWPILFEATLSSGVHPPLFYILYKIALSMWGITEFGARFLTVVTGLLTIPLIYRLGKVMFDQPTGLIAAVLLAINPIHVWLSQEARMYGLLILLVTASMFFFWQSLRTNHRHYWIGLMVVNALAFNLHYFSLWIPVVQFVVILSDFARYLRQFRHWVATQFVAGLALLPWLIATALREYQSFGIGFLKTPNLMDLPLTLWNFTVGFSSYFFWPFTIFAQTVFVIALLSGLRRAKRKLRFAQMMLTLWLFIPLILVWIISQRRSFYADRYLSFVMPSLILLLAFGVSRITQTRWRSFLMIGLIMANGYGLVNTRFDPAFQKDDWRNAAAYVSQNEQTGDVILLYTTHTKFAFDYYYQGNLPQKPLSLNLKQFALEPLVKNYQRAWVVYPYTRRPTHYPMQPLMPNGYWDDDPDRNPDLVKWLEAHTDKIIDYQHFRGIQMWLVDLSAAE